MVVIMIACVVMSFFILVQKPKGGGLSGAFGSVGAQVMGVKQSGDAMEKGTWYTMAIIAALSIISVFTLGNINPKAAPQQQTEQQSGQQQPAGPVQQPGQ
jgi:preprotein translocase subunit SecG